MKITYCIFLLLFLINFGYANVWQGDYLIQSQADADAFRRDCNCTSINGNLIITGDVKHVDSLFAVIDINGGIEISNTTQFNSFYGLRRILKIKFDLKIINNQFTTIEGFDRLKSIGGEFEIIENENLKEIKGFDNLERVTVLHIESNPKLKQFTVFKKLEYFQQLLILRNESLTTIRELDVSTEIGRFAVWENKNLTQIGGFNNVTLAKYSVEIGENPSLKIINAFKKIKKIGSYFYIYENDQLSELSGFDQLEVVDRSCTLRLPPSLVNKDHFQNLTVVEDYFNTNISNFNKLDSVGKIFLGGDQIPVDTLYGPSSITKIGSIDIVENNLLKHIHGFSGLRNLVELRIRGNPNLKQIEGFNSLDSLGSPLIDFNFFVVSNNASLHTISGFNQFKKICGSFHLTLNDKLTNISAFNQLEMIAKNCTIDLPVLFAQQNIFNNLMVVKEKLITNVANFKTLENVGGLCVKDDILNTDTLRGFSTLKKIGTLQISSNEKLKHIAAFNALEVASIQIDSNKNLISIAGFDKLHTIEFGLNIFDHNTLKDITAFRNLHTITGAFNFQNNHAITDISFFNRPEKIDRLVIERNNKLTGISGFKNLKFANQITLSRNPNIENISSFHNLSKIGGRLSILRNPKLKQVTELNNLINAGSILIMGNVNLQKIEGFKSLEEILEIDISSNNNLLSIEGFNRANNLLSLTIENRNLRKIDAFTQLKVLNDLIVSNNIQLKSIDNFSSIIFIANQLILNNNLQLNNCCLVDCWLNNGVVDELSVNIGNNGMNCTSLQSIKMFCEDDSCPVNELGLSGLKANNPVREHLQFSFIIFEEQAVNYTIYNINDQLIQKGSATGNKGFNLKSIGLPEVESGYYFLQIKGKDTGEVVKFLKL